MREIHTLLRVLGVVRLKVDAFRLVTLRGWILTRAFLFDLLDAARPAGSLASD